MKLWPAESIKDNDPDVGGFIVEFDNGVRKSIAWRSKAPINPSQDAARAYAETLINHCLQSPGMLDEVRSTNWVSAIAAIQKIIQDWNETFTQRLYAADLAKMMPNHGALVQ